MRQRGSGAGFHQRMASVIIHRLQTTRMQLLAGGPRVKADPSCALGAGLIRRQLSAEQQPGPGSTGEEKEAQQGLGLCRHHRSSAA